MHIYIYHYPQMHPRCLDVWRLLYRQASLQPVLVEKKEHCQIQIAAGLKNLLTSDYSYLFIHNHQYYVKEWNRD